jgi:hypothetical protein
MERYILPYLSRRKPVEWKSSEVEVGENEESLESHGSWGGIKSVQTVLLFGHLSSTCSLKGVHFLLDSSSAAFSFI